MAADPQHSNPAGQSAETQEQMQVLARKLLDLWQDHLSALAQDPTLMAQVLKLMAAYSPFSWPQPGIMPTAGAGFAPFPGGPFQFGVAPGPAVGPAPAAAASDAGAGGVGELRSRLAELEGRLAELESGGGGKTGGKAIAKPARKRAARKPGSRKRLGGAGARTAKGR